MKIKFQRCSPGSSFLSDAGLDGALTEQDFDFALCRAINSLCFCRTCSVAFIIAGLRERGAGTGAGE